MKATIAAVLVGILAASSNDVVAQNVQSDSEPGPLAVSERAPEISYGTSEVVKLWQAGVGADVIATYINGSTAPYHLNADGIIYARSVGVPSEIVQAMLQRDIQLGQGTPTLPPPMALALPQPMVAPEPAPAPSVDSKVVIIGSDPPPPSVQVTVIGQGYPGYNYYYPYDDSFCASSTVVIGSRCVGGFGGGRFGCFSR